MERKKEREEKNIASGEDENEDTKKYKNVLLYNEFKLTGRKR